jgi:hypothetical protein
MSALPWRDLLRWAAIGWVIGLSLTVADLVSTRDTLGGLVDVSPRKPAAGVIAEDFPGEDMLLPGGDHDGPMFYAIARQPWALDLVAPSLDRPRYRSQRILFPVVSRLLHPVGVGDGLMWTMFAVGAAGVFAGALGMGALSVSLRGPSWPAVVFPVLTGSVISLRITTPDPLAVALVLWAIVLSLRDRRVAALSCAVAAILTREPVFVAVAGFAFWRRDRDGAVLVGAPLVIAGLWWAYLHRFLPAGEGDVQELVGPFQGWGDTIAFWRSHDEPLGMANTVIGFLVGMGALAMGRLRHPLGWAVALNLAFVVLLSPSVLGPERNASRTMLPLQVLAIVMIVTRHTTDRDAAHRATGPDPVVRRSESRGGR